MINVNALVIDDSGIMRKLVMRTLSETRLALFRFIEAGDGVEGLAKFEANEVDIMFVDWNMPNMTGIDFVRNVRAREKGHTPIVMVTTESTMGKVEEALDGAGADSYVVKPFTKEVMQQKLAPLFEQMSKPAKGAGFFGKLAQKLG